MNTINAWRPGICIKFSFRFHSSMAHAGEPPAALEEDNYNQSFRNSGASFSQNGGLLVMNNPRYYFDVSADGENIGRMVFELREDLVPRTVENFKKLCDGFDGKCYKTTVFHRIIPGFMCQGGDYENNDGTGSQSIWGDNFQDENFILKHDGFGVLSMANSGPDTNSAQFFITFGEAEWLDGFHVVFGRIIDGEETLRKIEECGTNCSRPTKVVKITDCGAM